MFYLPHLLTLITRKPRYKPEITWSDKSWTHNVFRFYELLFWRRIGIRHEMSASAIRDKTGKTTVTYKAYSFEALCALLEQRIRGLMPKFKLVKVGVPQLVFSGVGLFQSSPFMFAIGFDTSANTGNQASTLTLSTTYTVTGSNTSLWANVGSHSDRTYSSSSYNSVAMALASAQITGNTVSVTAIHLEGAATGSNTLSCTFTGSNDTLIGEIASYTGVKQTGQPSAVNSTGSIANHTSPLSQSVTTVDDNSWLVWAFLCGLIVTAGSNTTVRQQEATAYGSGIADTNAAQTPTGSKTVNATFGGGGSPSFGGILCAISPATAAAGFNTKFLLMGVGK